MLWARKAGEAYCRVLLVDQTHLPKEVRKAQRT